MAPPRTGRRRGGRPPSGVTDRAVILVRTADRFRRSTGSSHALRRRCRSAPEVALGDEAASESPARAWPWFSSALTGFMVPVLFVGFLVPALRGQRRKVNFGWLQPGMGRSGTITPLAPVRSRKWPVSPASIRPDRSNRLSAWRHQRAHARSREGGRHEPSFACGLPHAFVCPDRAWCGHGGSGRHRRAFEGSCAKHSAGGCRGTQPACRRGSGRAAPSRLNPHKKYQPAERGESAATRSPK